MSETEPKPIDPLLMEMAREKCVAAGCLECPVSPCADVAFAVSLAQQWHEKQSAEHDEALTAAYLKGCADTRGKMLEIRKRRRTCLVKCSLYRNDGAPR